MPINRQGANTPRADASKLIRDVFFEYLCVSLYGSLCYSCYTNLHKEDTKKNTKKRRFYVTDLLVFIN